MTNLLSQIAFIKEIDKLKLIQRKTRLINCTDTKMIQKALKKQHTKTMHDILFDFISKYISLIEDEKMPSLL